MKYFYDNFDIKFIVTGSSSFYIKNHFAESLADRKTIFDLFPLSFAKYLEFKDIEVKQGFSGNFQQFNQTLYNKFKSYILDYMRFGGFPEVVASGNDPQKTDYLKDIINSYIEFDECTYYIRLISPYTKKVKETPVEQDLNVLLRRAKALNLENSLMIGLYPGLMTLHGLPLSESLVCHKIKNIV